MKKKQKGKKKRVGITYLNKRKYCVGTEPSALIYIGVLVTSTTICHGGSVVSTLASQEKGRGCAGLSPEHASTTNYKQNKTTKKFLNSSSAQCACAVPNLRIRIKYSTSV